MYEINLAKDRKNYNFMRGMCSFVSLYLNCLYVKYEQNDKCTQTYSIQFDSNFL